MTILLLDPGLRSYRGHHFNVANVIRRELRRRNLPVRIVGHRAFSAESAAEHMVEQLFTVGTYDALSDDPLCWPMETALAGARLLDADLARLEVAPGDTLVWLMATPAQVMAAASRMARWPVRILNAFIGGLPLEGVDTMLWRYAWRRLPPRSVVSAVSTGAALAADYAKALATTVHVAPIFHASPVRDRRGASPIYVGVLGHQRPSKGIRHLPEVVRRAPPDVRWVIQDSGGEVPDILDALEAFDTVQVIRGAVQDWDRLLKGCDALFLPYERERYERMHSGLVAEALAGGMPMVFPDTPALVEQGHAGGAVAYAGDGPEAMAAALADLVRRFDPLAARALDASSSFGDKNGPKAFVDWLLEHELRMGRASARVPG